MTIGVFVAPGVVKATDANAALDRFNRSFEYDGLGDDYARFLLEELLPEVETKKTSDGRAIKLSHDGNDRAIGGESSGAIAAFTAAWERPDSFTRVFSSIGTYVDLRGGMRYPSLIRKYEPKPIRIFMQDGSSDLNIYGGDWWMVNQTMERAFQFAGYEVQHALGRWRAQRQSGYRGVPRRDALALEGLAEARHGGPIEERHASQPIDPGRAVAVSRRRLQVNRRPRSQQQGRGFLQRHEPQ